MAHKLELKVVAKSIETEQQLQFIKEIGCDYGQGFLLAKPLTLEQALQYTADAD